MNQDLLMKRRELIEKVLLGSVAFAGLAPILALAKSAAPIRIGAQQGRTCIDVSSLKNISYKGNELIVGEISVMHNENEYKFGLYVLRGDFPDALAPTVVIDRKEQRVFAYATDLEWSFAFGVEYGRGPSTAQVGREAGADGRLLSGEALWGLRHARRPSSATTASRSSGGRSPRWLKELG
jgi:hypothetical protein